VEPVRPPTLEQRVAEAREAAAEEDRDQALDQLRLASLALSSGDPQLAEAALRPAVIRMQNFSADGQFAAFMGAEDRKEWKGEPYEKMAAFFRLGMLLESKGDHGNALAMSKSALLADTGTRVERFRADFVPAFVLAALASLGLGEPHNAERSIERAVDAWTSRRLINALTPLLESIEQNSTERDVIAAKALLLAGLPAGVAAHPRDPVAAVAGALSHATDLRQATLAGKRSDRPPELRTLSRQQLRAAFDHLDRLSSKWTKRAKELPADLLAEVDADAEGLRSLLDRPSLTVVVERGQGPQKIATGRYGEVLQLVPSPPMRPPQLLLDGKPVRAQLLDSLSWQATTRGGRKVDGFLKGKAVFKDASGLLGYSMMVAGDIANATDEPVVAVFAYAAGAITWIAGVATNPRADTRAWESLPDQLWLVVADPAPGTHTLVLDGHSYSVDIPDRGSVVHLIPNTAPYGAAHFGTPCISCDVPLAIPSGGTP
jgi:tetratricopeptide (TPR) repeat protein